MAALRAEIGGLAVAGRETGQVEVGQNEWCVLIFLVPESNQVTNYVNLATDQQLGQLLELMQALKKDGEGEGQ